MKYAMLQTVLRLVGKLNGHLVNIKFFSDMEEEDHVLDADTIEICILTGEGDIARFTNDLPNGRLGWLDASGSHLT